MQVTSLDNKLVEDHLRSRQQAISTVVLSALGRLRRERGALTDWLVTPGAPKRLSQFQFEPA